MKTPVTAIQFTLKQFAVKNVTGHALIFCPQQSAFIRAPAQQGFHPMSARSQFLDEVRPDEARSSGHKTFHAGIIKILIMPATFTFGPKLMAQVRKVPGPRQP
jgi:hypothetical protein